MLKQEMILDPLMLGLANINEWCVKGLELSGECGRVIYELGGMKPGPRSFEGCSLWASEEMVSNQTAFPSTIFMKREREREREKRERRLFYFDLAMHSFFMGPYIRGKE